MTNAVISAPRRITVTTPTSGRSTDPTSGRPQTSRPQQRFPTLVQLSASGTAASTFEFPYPPGNLQYSNLTPEWVEIDRPGYVPLVGLSKYKLMRIQFEFLIAIPYDGIWYSVEDAISTLRRMATSTDRIYLYGMDILTREGLPLPGTQRRSVGANIFFRIVDFSIQSMRRNTENEIVAAQCSMVLQEDFVLRINAITMPAIQYPAILAPRTAAGPGDGGGGTARCTTSSSVLTGCSNGALINSIDNPEAFTKLFGP